MSIPGEAQQETHTHLLPDSCPGIPMGQVLPYLPSSVQQMETTMFNLGKLMLRVRNNNILEYVAKYFKFLFKDAHLLSVYLQILPKTKYKRVIKKS